jgi:hypothetical protein
MEQSEGAMRATAIYLALLMAAACQTPATVVPASTNGAFSIPTLSGPVRTVVLMQRQGAVPTVTIAIPSEWQDQAVSGEDTAIHRISGPSVNMQFEYWGLNTNLACHEVSCGLRQAIIDGRNVELNIASDARSWRAFVPMGARGGGPARGIRVSAECSSADACNQALAVLGSLRTA